LPGTAYNPSNEALLPPLNSLLPFRASIRNT
jgi:hypothetical protein